EPLTKLTSRTLAPKALRDELDAVRERGFARERDEAVLREASLAAATFDHSGHAVGATGVVGDTDRILPPGPARGLTGAAVGPARTYGRAEEFLGGWLRERGAGDVVVGSKWGYVYAAGWQVDADPPEVKHHDVETLRRQLGETRAQLGGALALYQIHSATPE